MSIVEVYLILQPKQHFDEALKQNRSADKISCTLLDDWVVNPIKVIKIDIHFKICAITKILLAIEKQ